jgi:2-polyprenyl-3-methyl-5-hydroxy-6-metoxy-1,4-benzoquinol methylase
MSFFSAAPAAPPRPVVEWEEVDCLLCGSRHQAPLIEAPDPTPDGAGLWFAVVQCQDCGLCFTNPRPSAASIGQFYPARYRPHRVRVHSRRSLRGRLLSGWARRCKEPQTLPWHGKGRLLDFGCGGGAFLERMHRLGWDVLGLDISATAVEQVQQCLGLKALAGTLPHPALQPESFDVITMWHALEHVHQPLEVLQHAHRLLAPGGQLVVAVPNIDSLPFRWFGSAWYGLDLPRHLTHFSPWTLQLMLERAGFKPEPVRMIRHSDWLRCSARLASQYRRRDLPVWHGASLPSDLSGRNGTVPAPRTPHWHRWLTGKPASGVISWYSYLTYQSDCMLVTACKQ